MESLVDDLRNFRNDIRLDLDLSHGVTLLLGDDARRALGSGTGGLICIWSLDVSGVTTQAAGSPPPARRGILDSLEMEAFCGSVRGHSR